MSRFTVSKAVVAEAHGGFDFERPCVVELNPNAAGLIVRTR